MMMRIMPILAGALLHAAPGLADPEGVYCADGGDSFLIARPAGNGGVDLRISSWQATHHCGISGIAQATQDGWLLEAAGCKLHLREEGGALVLATSPDAACEAACGARANLDGISFASAGRMSANADPSLFAQDLGALGPC